MIYQIEPFEIFKIMKNEEGVEIKQELEKRDIIKKEKNSGIILSYDLEGVNLINFSPTKISDVTKNLTFNVRFSLNDDITESVLHMSVFYKDKNNNISVSQSKPTRLTKEATFKMVIPEDLINPEDPMKLSARLFLSRKASCSGFWLET